jgi:2-oxo-3-hexenedioate decarboxylase
MAPGFEIVQSHFPGWKFAAADCTAAFWLHCVLVVGAPLAVTDANRAALAAALPAFELTLSRGDIVIDRGVGANVLGSPALALAHLARLLADQPVAEACRRRDHHHRDRDRWPGRLWPAKPGPPTMAPLESRA